jgi:dolichyl-phosphate beta-glucosyltransferase
VPNNLLLSVVVPAYNEQERIEKTLKRVAEYLNARGYTYEVLVVSDGSSDQTEAIVNTFASQHLQFQLLSYRPNRGKGYAVRYGMLHAQGEYLLFSDADLAAPIEELEKLMPCVQSDYEIAIGSRPLKESNLVVRQPFYREWLGRAFNKAVQLLAVKGIQDTQCGFKLFRREVAHEIFRLCRLDGFSFDFEVLYLARRLGYKIAEVPIKWMHQPGSKVRLLRDGPRMLRDLVWLRVTGWRRFALAQVKTKNAVDR